MSVFASAPVSVGLRVGGCMFVRPSRGRGRCKVSSLLSRRADMQPTDMHSPLLQPQPRLLQPLLPLTATGTYERQRAPRRPLVSPPSALPASRAAPGPAAARTPGFSQASSQRPRLRVARGTGSSAHSLVFSSLALTPVSLFVTSNSLLSRLRAVLQNLSEHCI